MADSMKPEQQKETRRQRARFRERIRGAYQLLKSGIISSDVFASKAGEALDEEFQQLPVVPAGKMIADDVVKGFGLKWGWPNSKFHLVTTKPTPRSWMTPPNRINFTHCFMEVMERLDGILFASPTNETAIRARVNLLLTEICATVNDQRPSIAKPLHLQMESSFFWEPVDYKGKPHRLDGKPDYSLWYGFEEDTSCNLVIVETKTVESASTGQGQVLAYMAIVHKRRKEQHKENCTVYGVSTDYSQFIFFEIDNNGKVWMTMHSLRDSFREGTLGLVANILAEFIYQAALLSPIQSRTQSRAFTRASRESAPMAGMSIDSVLDEDKEMEG